MKIWFIFFNFELKLEVHLYLVSDSYSRPQTRESVESGKKGLEYESFEYESRLDTPLPTCARFEQSTLLLPLRLRLRLFPPPLRSHCHETLLLRGVLSEARLSLPSAAAEEEGEVAEGPQWRPHNFVPLP